MGSLHCTASPAGIHTDPARRQSTVLKKKTTAAGVVPGSCRRVPQAQCTVHAVAVQEEKRRSCALAAPQPRLQ